jgi:hypothetical protein
MREKTSEHYKLRGSREKNEEFKRIIAESLAVHSISKFLRDGSVA